MRLVRLARDFRRAVLYATRMISKGIKVNDILKELRGMLNKAYGDSAYKVAKAIVEGCRFNGGEPQHVKIRRLFIVSEGEASRLGNRNVRIESTDLARIKYPYDKSWILLKVRFGKKYLPLIRELIELIKQRKVSFGARILFRDGKIYLHLSVPINLYLKYFSKGRAGGCLIAGFDLNSDRVNMVIIDRYGKIRDIKTGWFPEVTSHGYPRSKARAKRLEALAKLLRYAYHHNVGTVVFENLLTIKQRRCTGNPTANRKITKFAKRELLQYGIVMSMKYGFKTLLINPKGTTHSSEHNYIMRKHGLDKHTASAYLIALKGIESHMMIQKAVIYRFCPYTTTYTHSLVRSL
ncbi:MAG: hypothetical protein B6U85_03885 [Desulfurococcales archaeon ex4484_42]|nr:MAG: hypothetical protein B6U85_03885 [Desulfurococcales archaeon ex4484_42]